MNIVEISNKELENLEQEWFRDLATQAWEQKYQEDLEADIFGFYEMDFKIEV